MIIINADDWGGWTSATNAALACVRANRVNSVTAMVFMADSERGANLAHDAKIDVGLHVNFNEPFSGSVGVAGAIAAHDRIRRFLRRWKYSLLLYNPWIRDQFRFVFHAQANEFERLYGRKPSHIDGHQHMHLCTNVLLDKILPAGERVRRSFSFFPGEKSLLNRCYRSWVDGCLHRRNVITDYFFALSQCIGASRLPRVLDLAKTKTVELMTHPEKGNEGPFLLSKEFGGMLNGVSMGTYLQVEMAGATKAQ